MIFYQIYDKQTFFLYFNILFVSFVLKLNSFEKYWIRRVVLTVISLSSRYVRSRKFYYCDLRKHIRFVHFIYCLLDKYLFGKGLYCLTKKWDTFCICNQVYICVMSVIYIKGQNMQVKEIVKKSYDQQR